MLSEDKLTTSGLAVSAFVFYNQTDESIDSRVSCQIVHSRNIVGIVSLLSLQVLKTLPAFVIGLIVKICRFTSKISFFGYVR